MSNVELTRAHQQCDARAQACPHALRRSVGACPLRASSEGAGSPGPLSTPSVEIASEQQRSEHQRLKGMKRAASDKDQAHLEPQKERPKSKCQDEGKPGSCPPKAPNIPEPFGLPFLGGNSLDLLEQDNTPEQAEQHDPYGVLTLELTGTQRLPRSGLLQLRFCVERLVRHVRKALHCHNLH